MSLSPSRRLLLAGGSWVALASAAVAWPALTLASGAAALLLLAAVLVDGVALRRRPLPELARELPERAFLGRPARLHLVLRNRSEVPIRAELFEELPADLGDPEPRFSVEVAPARAQTVQVPLTPAVRGDRGLGVPVALEAGPLGLVRRRVLGPSGQTLRVYPDTRRFLSRDALDPRRLVASLGIRPARRRGDGSEFDSLREYTPGDDPRRLDWAASARRGRPVVKQYRHERNHTVIIAVDASRLMASREQASTRLVGGHGQTRTKLDYAVDAALALAHAAVASGDRVGMTVFDRQVRGHLSPRRHRRDLGEFVELLTDVHPRIVEGDFAALARTLAVHQRARALVVILTDFAETENATFLGPLAVLGRRHRVLLVALRDRVFRHLEAGAPVAGPRQGSGPWTRGDGLEPYRNLVLEDLLAERETALLGLRRRGLQTLDLPPAQVTGAVLNRYLEMREAPGR